MSEVVDAFSFEGVGDPFCDEDGDHVRDDVFEFAGKFKHDDAEGDGHAGDAGEEGSGADHGEDAGGDGWYELADEAAEEGAGVEGGDNDARGDFAAEGDDCEDELDEGTVDEVANVFWWGASGFVAADPGGGVGAAVLEEIADDFVAGFAGHRIGILEKGSGKDNEEHLKDGVVLDELELTEAFGPEEIAFAEYSAPEASCDTQEHEDEVVDWRIGCSVIGLIERQLACTSGIERLQDHCSPKRAEESTPKDLSRKIGADFLYSAEYKEDNDPANLPRS